MTKEHILDMFDKLVTNLQAMELQGDALKDKDKLVKTISLLSRIIVDNELKEGTKALENSSRRLTSITEKLEEDKGDLEKTAGNLKKVFSVLGTVSAVIRFV